MRRLKVDGSLRNSLFSPLLIASPQKNTHFEQEALLEPADDSGCHHNPGRDGSGLCDVTKGSPAQVGVSKLTKEDNFSSSLEFIC